MECVIQVFPDEYHLNTLDKILKTCCELQKSVDIKSIIVGLIDRLANYATTTTSAIPASVDVFGFFYKNLSAIISERTTLPIQDSIQMIIALLKLSMQCYPSNLEYVDRLFVFAAEILGKLKENKFVSSPFKFFVIF